MTADVSRNTPSSQPASAATPPKRRRRWLVFLLLALILLVVGVAIWRGHQAGAGKYMARPTAPVQVRPVVSGDLKVYLDQLGTVTASNSVTVHTMVTGQLFKLYFTEGQTVKEGDLLALIDPRPYQVALTQAEGTLVHDQANLANARIDLQRYKTLVAQNSIATQTLDTQTALVRQLEGTVKTDQGAVDSARLNLVYCRVTAPADGVVGLRQVDVGNIVHTSDTNGIVVINRVHPIYVLFNIPEDNIPDVLKAQRQGPLRVEAWDRERKNKLAEGQVISIDNQVDTTTGTVRIRAQFDNQDGMLFSNQFVQVRLLVETRPNSTMIPTAAVQRGSAGNLVFVVDADNVVHSRVVTLGPVDGEQVNAISGVTPGDRVVIDGMDKLKDGGTVKIVDPNAPQPASDAPASASGGKKQWSGHGHHRHSADQ